MTTGADASPSVHILERKEKAYSRSFLQIYSLTVRKGCQGHARMSFRSVALLNEEDPRFSHFRGVFVFLSESMSEREILQGSHTV